MASEETSPGDECNEGAHDESGDEYYEEANDESASLPPRKRGFIEGNASSSSKPKKKKRMSAAQRRIAHGDMFQGAGAHGQWLTGEVGTCNGKYGFILQDHDRSQLFVMPDECRAFGREIPMIGTRVLYMKGVNPKNGDPRAENVSPDLRGAQYAQHAPAPLPVFPPGFGPLTGQIDRVSDKYGFILQDHDRSQLFVMPSDCQAFDRQIPAVGTRVLYLKGMNPRTSEPCAKNVTPDLRAFAPAPGFGPYSGWPGMGMPHYPPPPTHQFPRARPSKAPHVLAGRERKGAVDEEDEESEEDEDVLPRGAFAFLDPEG